MGQVELGYIVTKVRMNPWADEKKMWWQVKKIFK